MNTSIKVLLIEDDAIDQMIFKRFIKGEKYNFNVSYAGSVKSAKEILINNTFDIVVIDYSLGDGTAFDLIDYINDTPIIFTTGVGDEETAVKAMKIGIYDYIIKDVDRNYIKLIPVAIHKALKVKKDNEQLHMLSQAIMTVSDSIFICDMNYNITFFNKSFKECYGYNDDEILNQNSSLIWNDVISFNNSFENLILCGSGEYINKRKDGSLFPVQITSTIIKNNNGKNTGIINIVRDITERKQIEENLLIEKNKAQRYLDIAGVMLIMFDRNFDITMINQKGCEILEFDKSEVIGRNWFELLIPENDIEDLKSKFNIWLKDDSNLLSYYENIVLSKGGNEKIIAWHNIILKDKKGEATGVLCSGEDITMRVEIDKMKSEFVNTVSHEIRTPLTVISGICQLLLLNKDLDATKIDEYYNIMNNEAKRLGNLVNDYLDIQRMENGRQVFEMDVVSILDIIYDTIEIYSSNKTHKIYLDIDKTDYSPIFADYNKVKQLLTNLLSNAIKYSPDSEKIIIKVRESKDSINVDVIDYGLGIPEDCIPNLFTKFFRIGLSEHRKIMGTGLGLAICKEIVTAHNGTIGVKSEVGKGSKFYFNIPKYIVQNLQGGV